MSLETLNALIPEETPTPQPPPGDLAGASMGKLSQLIPPDPTETVQPTPAAVDPAAVAVKSSQPSFQMVGSMVGGALGAPAGPLGIAAGGALGAVAGEFAFQTVEDISRLAGVEDLGESPTFSERITKAGKEGVIDLGFSVGTQAVADVAKYGFKHLIPNETKELIKEADKLGVEPTKIVVTNNKLQRYYGSVIGRFPFAAGKFRTRSREAIGQLSRAKENLFMRLGPSWDMAKIGVKLDDAYKNEYKTFRKAMNDQYGRILDESRAVGAFVKTDDIKQVADDAISRMRLARQALGESDDEVMAALKSDTVISRLRKYSQINKTVTLDEFRAIDELLDDDLKFAVAQGGTSVAQFGRIKDSFQMAKKTLHQLQAPPEGGKTIKEQLREVDKVFSTTMTEMFDTPVARKLERTVNKNMFKVGKFTKAGTKNPDESFKLMWNTKSPKGMEDLHRVVGDKRFGASARSHIEGIYDRAVQGGIDQYMNGQNKLAFDFNGFKRSLGIGDPKSLEYQTMKKTLELSKSGVTMKDLSSFTALLENALRNSPDDVNTFIARRAAFGGTVTSTMAGSVLGVGTLFLTRGIGRILSGKPLIVRASMMLDPNISFQHRKALALSLEKMLEDQ